jgi:hypothetical protein
MLQKELQPNIGDQYGYTTLHAQLVCDSLRDTPAGVLTLVTLGAWVSPAAHKGLAGRAIFFFGRGFFSEPAGVRVLSMLHSQPS